jgi:hypothetical protein
MQAIDLKFSSTLKSRIVKDPLWLTPKEILQLFYNNELQLLPEVKQIIHNLYVSRTDDEFAELCREQVKNELPGLQTKLEYSPHIECIPIASDTLLPFTTTNLVVISSENRVIVVDPGASEKGRSHLVTYLHSLKQLHSSLTSVDIFITHKHRDHIASIDVVADLFPHSQVLHHNEHILSLTHTHTHSLFYFFQWFSSSTE